MLKRIAKIYTDFNSKFGIPRQSSLAKKSIGRIVFEPEYRDYAYIKGIEDFSYLWLIWGFSENERKSFSATVRPPRLDKNKTVGVWASRSPFRPNGLGLSSVKLERVEFDDKYGNILVVSGVDMLNETPIYDIKPYIPYADIHEDALEGYTRNTKNHRLKVEFEKDLLDKIPEDKKEALIEILSLDARPSYDIYENKIYAMKYMNFDIKFIVDDNTLRVIDIEILV